MILVTYTLAEDGTPPAIAKVTMRSLFVSIALLAAAATTSGCLTDQSYTPIGEDREDELCRQSVIDLLSEDSQVLELDASGKASYSGSLEVTQFTRTSMEVQTDELIVAVPEGGIVSIEVNQGSYEFFTSMVFALDARPAGAQEWQAITIDSNQYEIFWFSSVEINSAQSVGAISTLSLCSTREISNDNTKLPPEFFSGDFEVRIRTFPFDGFGDLVGMYNYDVNVSVQ